jgi:glycosyltransferase involved in cell wall biosynthesis
MKIVIDAYQAMFIGGIARYARSLISSIIEITPPNEVVLFYNRFLEKRKAWRPKKRTCQVRQVFFPRRLLQGIWDSFEWPPIETFCGSIDLFHGLHFVLPPVRKARRVLTVHDLTYLKFPDYFENFALNERGYRRELPRALAQADAVITDSQKTKEDLSELMKFPEERVRVIYMGIDHCLFTQKEGQKAATLQKLYGLSRPYLIYLVGTPEPRKNLTRTVVAVRKAAPQLDLVLIGPQGRLKKLLGDNLQNIIFTDVVPDEQLPALLSGATISLYPSLYEGFGLPVLESMACGVPVITSNRGSLPEVAGGAAILVNPEDEDDITDAISELSKNESLQNRLRVMGRKRAGEFTWQKSAAQTLSLYRELV